MMPSWYTASGAPTDTATASDLRTEFSSVQSGFADYMPEVSAGNAGKLVMVNSAGTALEAASLSKARATIGIETPVRVYKSADENRTSSTNTIDSELQFALESGKTYEIEYRLMVVASTTCTFEWTLIYGSAGQNVDLQVGGWVSHNADNDITFYPGSNQQKTATTTVLILVGRALIKPNASETLGLYWSSDDGTSTVTIKKYSYMTYREIA